MFAEMEEAKFFGKLGALAEFWQIPWTQSFKICTFNKPLGRYGFLRLLSKICSVPEVVHCTTLQMLEVLSGIKALLLIP